MFFGVHAQASSLVMDDCVSVFFFHHSPASGDERVKQTRPSTHEAGSYEGLRAGSREGPTGWKPRGSPPTLASITHSGQSSWLIADRLC